ncbi:MAG: hypothetical protein K0S57_3535 [Ramlibacter sp.]|jgi:hypothetical protein|nr:hypothetical protein [Ramlibacter sp.]
MRITVIGLLLALPGLTFFLYSSEIGNSPQWMYFWPNYAWCAAVLFIAALVLAAKRARFSIWLVSLIAGNLALVGFCVWMASLLARGYKDTEIAWILVFPIQVFIIFVAVMAHRIIFLD